MSGVNEYGPGEGLITIELNGAKIDVTMEGNILTSHIKRIPKFLRNVYRAAKREELREIRKNKPSDGLISTALVARGLLVLGVEEDEYGVLLAIPMNEDYIGMEIAWEYYDDGQGVEAKAIWDDVNNALVISLVESATYTVIDIANLIKGVTEKDFSLAHFDVIPVEGSPQFTSATGKEFATLTGMEFIDPSESGLIPEE